MTEFYKVKRYIHAGSIDFVNYATGGDFGATKERLGLFGLSADGNVYPILRVHWKTDDNVQINDMLETYNQALDENGYEMPKAAGLGLAGMISEDAKSCNLTNSPKKIEKHDFEDYGIDASLYNDFFVNSAAVPHLKDSDYHQLFPEHEPKEAYRSDLFLTQGPGGGHGFGLGRSLGHGRIQLRASEGGHTAYCPTGPLEDSIVRFIREKYNCNHFVECEQLASGIGIGYIFDYFNCMDPPRDDERYSMVIGLKEEHRFNALMERIADEKPAVKGRMIVDEYNNGFGQLEVGLAISAGASAIAGINGVQLENGHGGSVYIFGGNARRTAKTYKEHYRKVFDNPPAHKDGLRSTKVFLVTGKGKGALGAAALMLQPDRYEIV